MSSCRAERAVLSHVAPDDGAKPVSGCMIRPTTSHHLYSECPNQWCTAGWCNPSCLWLPSYMQVASHTDTRHVHAEPRTGQDRTQTAMNRTKATEQETEGATPGVGGGRQCTI